MLWIKPGLAPQPLPGEDYDAEGFAWTDLENNEVGRQRCGWTEAPEPPDYDPATQALSWSDAGWTVTDLPPVEAAPPAPVRIGKYWLFQRFSEDQERQYSKLEYQARNLTPIELDDPANEALFQLQRFIRRLDALQVVELNAEATVQGFGLLCQLGVFGDPADPASTDAMTAILQTPPTPLEYS